MKNEDINQDRLNQIIGRNVKFYRELYNIAVSKNANAKLTNRYKKELVYYFGDVIWKKELNGF